MPDTLNVQRERPPVTRTSILELSLGHSPYSFDIIEHQKGVFLSVAGAKKGSFHKGGGIAVPDLRSLDNLVNLIEIVQHLRLPSQPVETRVAFCSEKSRFLSGETKLFDGKWFYRIKVYRNFFKNEENGKYTHHKEHGLRPEGYGFYIQEMDFPISDAGREFAREFTSEILTLVRKALNRSFATNQEIDVFTLTREFRILLDGELPWIRTRARAKAVCLCESLLDTVGQVLLDEPHTEESLASRLFISPNLASSFTNVTVRYNPEFLARSIAIDRVRGPNGNFQYQATRIPEITLRQSPLLTHLLDERADGDWPTWKRVTFSNDQFAQGRSASLSHARFEVEAFCGGQIWAVPLSQDQVRATALRLFDLQRHFEKHEQPLAELQQLSKRFISAVSGT